MTSSATFQLSPGTPALTASPPSSASPQNMVFPAQAPNQVRVPSPPSHKVRPSGAELPTLSVPPHHLSPPSPWPGPSPPAWSTDPLPPSPGCQPLPGPRVRDIPTPLTRPVHCGGGSGASPRPTRLPEALALRAASSPRPLGPARQLSPPHPGQAPVDSAPLHRTQGAPPRRKPAPWPLSPTFRVGTQTPAL